MAQTETLAQNVTWGEGDRFKKIKEVKGKETIVVRRGNVHTRVGRLSREWRQQLTNEADNIS